MSTHQANKAPDRAHQIIVYVHIYQFVWWNDNDHQHISDVASWRGHRFGGGDDGQKPEVQQLNRTRSHSPWFILSSMLKEITYLLQYFYVQVSWKL